MLSTHDRNRLFALITYFPAILTRWLFFLIPPAEIQQSQGKLANISESPFEGKARWMSFCWKHMLFSFAKDDACSVCSEMSTCMFHPCFVSNSWTDNRHDYISLAKESNQEYTLGFQGRLRQHNSMLTYTDVFLIYQYNCWSLHRPVYIHSQHEAASSSIVAYCL